MGSRWSSAAPGAGAGGGVVVWLRSERTQWDRSERMSKMRGYPVAVLVLASVFATACGSGTAARAGGVGGTGPAGSGGDANGGDTGAGGDANGGEPSPGDLGGAAVIEGGASTHGGASGGASTGGTIGGGSGGATGESGGSEGGDSSIGGLDGTGGSGGSGGPGGSGGSGDLGGSGGRYGSGGSGGSGGGGGMGGGSGAPRSLEMGRTLWGVDYPHNTDGLSVRDGILFSVWTRIPDPGTALFGDPTTVWSRGNLDVVTLDAANWNIIAIDGNCSVIIYDGQYGEEFGPVGTVRARYNANTMFGTLGAYWIGDYSYFESDYYALGRTQEEVKDWVWVAWHVVLHPDDSFTVRQWLRFGPGGPVFDATNAGTDLIARDVVVARMIELGEPEASANAWTPDATVAEVSIGENNGYFWHARIAQGTVSPTLAELTAISEFREADTGAWAFYPLEWRDGAPFLDDTSGHGHHLQMMTNVDGPGTLYAGPPAPVLP